MGGARPLEASQMFGLYLVSNTNQTFWKPTGRLIGAGSGEQHPPPGISLVYVFFEPLTILGRVILRRRLSTRCMPAWIVTADTRGR
jgi:hypothetical protein